MGINEVPLRSSEIEIASREYFEAAQKAHGSASPELELKAAQLAPALFLRKNTHFEYVFDLIIHHLHEALAKTVIAEERALISRLGEEMFYHHMYAVVAAIDFARERANRNLFDAIGSWFTNAKRVAVIAPYAGYALVDIAPATIRVIEAYFAKLLTEWSLQSDEKIFYRQVARLLRKIARAGIYTGRFTLLQNYYLGNKDLLLPLVVKHENVDCAIALLQFDNGDEESARTYSIIAELLGHAQRFEEFATLCKTCRRQHSQLFPQISRQATELFRVAVDGAYRGAITGGGRFVNSIVAACVIFFIVVYAVQHKATLDSTQTGLLAVAALATGLVAYLLSTQYVSWFVRLKTSMFRRNINTD